MGETIDIEKTIRQEYKPGKYKKHIIGEDFFNIYKEEITKLMDEFGMGDVWYVFQHANDKGYRASCAYTSDHRMTFSLSTAWYGCDVPDEESIRQVARHEVAHALNGRINILAQTKGESEEAVYNANEGYANRIERYITRKEAYIRELETALRELAKEHHNVEKK